MTAIEYDPFSDEAMSDPHPIYRRLRQEDPLHYIEKYRAWALTKFEDVWEVSRRQDEWITFEKGALPGQLLLGEPIPHTFMTMDAPAHRYWRGLVRKDYSPEGVKREAARIRTLVQEILSPLLGRDEFDVYTDLANPVLCINAGYNLGLPVEDAIHWRALIDEMLHRDPGQVGTVSERNQRAAEELFGYINSYIQKLMAHPEQAVRHTAAFMNGEFEGKRLSAEELTFYVYSLLVVGSETTPMTVAGTLYYLHQNPEQKQAVLRDRTLIKDAFLETARFDQPTNMLARRAKVDFELRNRKIRKDDNLLFIYASANRDEDEFDRPDVYDIFRKPKRDLSFGTGGHKCLGMHLAVLTGVTILEELLSALGDYTIDTSRVERAYGEHLLGFVSMPIRRK